MGWTIQILEWISSRLGYRALSRKQLGMFHAWGGNGTQGQACKVLLTVLMGQLDFPWGMWEGESTALTISCCMYIFCHKTQHILSFTVTPALSLQVISPALCAHRSSTCRPGQPWAGSSPLLCLSKTLPCSEAEVFSKWCSRCSFMSPVGCSQDILPKCSGWCSQLLNVAWPRLSELGNARMV